MSYFFFAVLLAGLLPALWLALAPPPASRQGQIPAMVVGLLAGRLVGQLYPGGQLPLLALHGYRLLLPLLFLLVLPAGRWGRTGFTFAFALMSGLLFIRDPNIQNFTATAVINSALLLNAGAVLAGVLMTALLALSSARLINQLPQWRRALLWLLFLLYALPLSGELLLSLIKLGVLPLQTVLLSYIARVTSLQTLLPFAALTGLAALGAVGLWQWLRPLKAALQTAEAGNPQRKASAQYLLARRWHLAHLLLVVLTLQPGLYWHLVASRPPQLSAATEVHIAADGKVHIPVSAIRDGNLHRFAWVAPDGKVVRFIVINRYPQQLKFGVAFDACLLCGDQGYIQEGNQIICVACGVHIFIPSIGKPGGCNPVPLEAWQLAGDGEKQELLISRQELENGTAYFSAAVEQQEHH